MKITGNSNNPPSRMGAYLSKTVLGVGAYSGGGLLESGGLFDHLRYIRYHCNTLTMQWHRCFSLLWRLLISWVVYLGIFIRYQWYMNTLKHLHNPKVRWGRSGNSTSKEQSGCSFIKLIYACFVRYATDCPISLTWNALTREMVSDTFSKSAEHQVWTHDHWVIKQIL